MVWVPFLEKAPPSRFDEEAGHFLISTAVNFAAKNPYVFVGSLIAHAAWHLDVPRHDPRFSRWLEEIDRRVAVSRGGGGPLGITPTSTAASVTTPKRASESRKAFKAQSAHGFRKTKGVSARGKCPKGHYWSYKKKKCLKSKF